MPGHYTSEQLLKAAHYRLEQWVTSVGTIGDRTTLADVQKMAGLNIPELRAQFGPADRQTLSDKDMLVVQAEVRHAASQARGILESDSITQRLSRTVGSSAAYAVETGKGVLSSMVQGAYDPAMPPLPIMAGGSGALRGQR